MTVEALVTPLLRVQLFKDLQPLHLAKIARAAERIVFRPGELIIREGGVADAAYLVVAGEATRIDGPDIEGEEPLPGNALIGEMGMLIETEHTSTVVAKSQVRALRIPRESLHQLMEEDPAIAEHFIEKLTGRLHHLAAELRRIDDMLAEDSTEHGDGRTLTKPELQPALH